MSKDVSIHASRFGKSRLRHHWLYYLFQASLLILGSIVIIYPLIWMISCSLKPEALIHKDMYSILFPINQISFENYAYAWQKAGIGSSFLNSFKITGISLTFMILFAYLTSYALARIEFVGRNLLMTFFVTLMLVPLGQVVMIPQYRLIKALGLNNTHFGIILLYINGGIPFSVFLLSSFISRIPLALDEAAYIDGASRLRITFQIIFPLSLPGLATVIIFQFMQIWNDYFTPLIYLVTPAKHTVTQGLKNFCSGPYAGTDYHYLFAALCIVSVPIIIVFLLFQNLFISGITAGSVKE